jgi:drug/metabolite transporter (DMT)-like permease
LIAGMILILFAKMRGHRIRPTRREIGTLIVSGTLLWPVANGLVVWAEQRADSGVASLLVALAPLWVAVIDAIVDRRPPSPLLVTGLLVGFSGIGLLSAPVLMEGFSADALSIGGLLLAGVFWGSGSLLQNRRKVELSPFANSGLQHLVGSVGFLIAITLLQEPKPEPTPPAWAALGYLIVFGSILGFTSFTQTLRLLPSSIAMTYAYVNPVIALILGFLVLHEPITFWKVGGSALILLGVFLVFRDRYRNRPAGSTRQVVVSDAMNVEGGDTPSDH